MGADMEMNAKSRPMVLLDHERAVHALDLINEANRVNAQYAELENLLGPGRVPMTIGETNFDLDYHVMLEAVRLHLNWVMNEARAVGVEIELHPISQPKLNRVA